MDLKFKRAALATIGVIFVGVAPTLSAFNGNFGFQYNRHLEVRKADEQANEETEAEAKVKERREGEVNRQQEAEAKVAPQASQLQFLYTYYIWMDICAERFAQFGDTKVELREILRNKEANIPPEQAESIWNVTAEKFQQLEGVLKIAGDVQLYTDCDQNSRYIDGFLTLASQMHGPSPPPATNRPSSTSCGRCDVHDRTRRAGSL
jgi:hypothetical protein